MLEVSRRNFLKATALSAVCLSGLNASFLEFSQAKQVKYFIKDSEIPHQGNFINADEILLIEKDISNIYSQLKEAFENKEVLKAPVVQILKGGLSVDVEGGRVFIPASLVSDAFESILIRKLNL